MTAKTFWFGVLGFIIGFLLVPKAFSHEWYDHECCHDQDCAPVTKIEKGPDNETDYMTTKNGSYAVRPTDGHKTKVSKDERYHLCANENRIICVYVPTTY